jgi:hypothetical protein
LRLSTRRLNRRLERLTKRSTARAGGALEQYRNDPVGYAEDVLGVWLWDEQKAILLALLGPPYRVSVDSGHNVGKTFVAAVAVNWWYDTRPQCAVITTAPTERDVVDLLWTEVRLQRARAKQKLPADLMPAAPVMRSGPEHYAKGYTARDSNSFQGRHRSNMLFIFDEKEGVGATFWTGTKSMFRPGSGDAWLVIGNPTTTTSFAYQEHRAVDAAGEPSWRRCRLNSITHPNIAAGLKGDPLPVPGAVTPEQVDQWVSDWCDPIPESDKRPTDIEWRVPCGADGFRVQWYRPGPIGESRILGLRPSAGTFGVWSEGLWTTVIQSRPEARWQSTLPVIGADCANYGTDYTVFHVRAGSLSLYHQAVNGWDVVQITDRLCELADQWAASATSGRDPQAAPVDPKQIAIQIDDDANGRAVSRLLTGRGYRAVPINASSTPARPDLYPRVRSELWFHAAKKAGLGELNLSFLPRQVQQRIELQALAPQWWPDEAGKRCVESKDDLRDPKRMGRSPDDMDAVNLAYYEPMGPTLPTGVTVTPPSAVIMRTTQRGESAAKRRGNYGLR